jgi:hypothetical protein
MIVRGGDPAIAVGQHVQSFLKISVGCYALAGKAGEWGGNRGMNRLFLYCLGIG